MNGILLLFSQTGSFWTALVWAVIPAAVVLAAIWWLDRYEKEPLRLVALALVFGAVLAPAIAYAIEKGLGISTSFTGQGIVPHFQLGPGLPLVEELVRAAAVLVALLLVRPELDDALDGIVYGGIVGVGFGGAANFISIWSTASFSGSSVPSLYTTAVTQLNHVFYGALIGLAIGLARKGSTAMMTGAAFVGAAAAVLLHLLHDYLPWWVATDTTSPGSDFWTKVLTQAPNYLGLVALGLIALWSVGREKVIVAQGLKDEPPDVVTPSDFANVPNSFRRSYTLWSALFSRGQRAWGLRRKLYGLQVELAFRKYHRREETSQESREFLSEDEYRQKIRETRKRLIDVDPAYAAESRAGAPKSPGHPFVAGLGGLTVFAALVATGVLIWVYALRPNSQPSNPQAATRAPAMVAAAAVAKTIGLYICSSEQAYRSGQCYKTSSSGFQVPRSAGHFLVVVHSTGLVGARITVALLDAGTRQPVSSTYGCSVRHANSYCTFGFSWNASTVGAVTTYVDVKVNGASINWRIPPLVHLV
jgi:RsiW-degrading membrane proteinase PrsW (M82 family)